MFTRHSHQLVRFVPAFLLVVVTVLGVTVMRSDSVAGVKTPPPRTAFKSGAQRSEIVLREIADTLKRIDARLERLEKAEAKRRTNATN